MHNLIDLKTQAAFNHLQMGSDWFIVIPSKATRWHPWSIYFSLGSYQLCCFGLLKIHYCDFYVIAAL